VLNTFIMKEAMFYKRLNNELVQCQLCPQLCAIKSFERGKCGVRENRQSNLFSLVYGKIAAMAVDPIEKKPLYHFYPNSSAFSISTFGCNMSCLFCQNYELSQAPKPNKPVYGHLLEPEEVVKLAIDKKASIIAYTYSEPTIAYEYYFDIMRIAKRHGLRNVFVTNGFIQPEPLKKLKGLLDAANIDLKSFSDEFYQQICGARLQPVLDAVKSYYELGVWIEVTTLVIPGLNDDFEQLNRISSFIASISTEIPWHITRFYPHYRMLDKPETPAESLLKAYEIGKQNGLKFVYIGNIMLGRNFEDTFCPKCGEVVISRQGFSAQNFLKRGGVCPRCNARVAGRF